jgi:DNA repair exonuclease SbcCD ATPase subunit
VIIGREDNMGRPEQRGAETVGYPGTFPGVFPGAFPEAFLGGSVDAATARSLSSISSLSYNTNQQKDPMHTGVSAAVAAMEQAVRRLDAALAQRASAFRALAEQHGLAAAELKTLREELQAARAEAESFRERAALVDALREELAQIQREEETVSLAAPTADAGILAARDAEIAALKAERDGLLARLAAVQAVPAPGPAPGPAPSPVQVGGDAGLTALKAELAAARAAQDEMQAFQSGIAARLEATMARLRQALDSQAPGRELG